MNPSTMTETMYSTKSIHNIINKTFTQVFNRKTMGLLWGKRKELEDGQADYIDCLYKSTKKKGTSRCESAIEYKLSSSNVGKLGYGRYYGSKGSMEWLEKDIRGTLCIDYYTDVDCVNCHPSIIPQMAKKWFNQDMPNMMKYVNNRQHFFDTMEEKVGFNSEMTKSFVLRILYGGSIKCKYTLPDDCDIDMPNEFIEMKKEMRTFTTSLMKEQSHKELLDNVQRLRKPNVPGSFTSHIVQTEERKILESMVHWFNENNYRVDVLAYDGAQIRKEEGKEITDDILTIVETIIQSDTGYVIKLKIKPFETMHVDDTTADEGELYQRMKEQWETNHFYFRPSNTICETGPDGIQHFGIEHATEAFNGWKCLDFETNKKLVAFLKEWRNDAERRIINRLVAKMPSDCEADEVSIFRGWEFQKHSDAELNQVAINTFCDLVRCCAGDDDKQYQYLLKCFARMIQNPLIKSMVCIILSSILQGSGKDSLMLWITKISGTHTAHYSSEESFWSPHDTSKEGAIFVHLEEASPGENQKRCDALKARITEDSTTINPKGVKAYTVPNIANHFMTTQHALPVKLEAHDRRFLILYPSDRCFKKGAVYWNDIYNNFETPSWLHSVGEFLMNYDITDFNPTVFPDTKLRIALLEVLETECSNVRFMKQWNASDCTSDELFESFKSWCIDNNEKYYSKMSFCKMIASRCSSLYNIDRRRDGVRYSRILE